MEKKKYGIIEAKRLESPPIDLLRVPHRKGILTVAHPAFGPDYFEDNIKEMQKDYSHPETGKKISFKEPTISQSILAVTPGFGSGEEVDAKRDIFDNPDWLQIGRIVRTSEGIFTNPPKNTRGKKIIDEKILKSFLNKCKKINEIWLYDGKDALDFGFAPYGTFTTGLQDGGDFAEEGLARLFEHTKEKTARNLREIASYENYPDGIDIAGFDEVKKPDLMLISLGSSADSDKILDVHGDWNSDWDGYAFGVLKDAEGVVLEK